MCKHIVYTTIVYFQMNVVYRRKIKNRKKKKLFAKKFPKTSHLDDSGISLPVFLSRTTLKLHNISVTPKKS